MRTEKLQSLITFKCQLSLILFVLNCLYTSRNKSEERCSLCECQARTDDRLALAAVYTQSLTGPSLTSSDSESEMQTRTEDHGDLTLSKVNLVLSVPA